MVYALTFKTIPATFFYGATRARSGYSSRLDRAGSNATAYQGHRSSLSPLTQRGLAGIFPLLIISFFICWKCSRASFSIKNCPANLRIQRLGTISA